MSSPFFEPTFLLSILIALSVHEWAHAYTAFRLGDPTAANEGRMTLNPLAHLDPLGTLMAVLVGFGWAKPVPVDPQYFRHPKRDNALVAVAGPVSNLVLATGSFILLLLLTSDTNIGNSMFALLANEQYGNPILTALAGFLRSMIGINLALMAFNLLPVAPLDGSKVIHPFVPLRYEDAYYVFLQRGPFVLIGILLFEHLLQIPILSAWVFGIMSLVLQGMNAVAGLFLA
jgi:Zn-dependent protease